MKVAVSADGMSRENLLDSRFGRCNYFQLYNSDTKEFRVIENNGQISSGGAGIAAGQQMIDEQVNIVITGSLGPNAFKILQKGNISAYTCEEISIDEVIKMWEEGKLERIDQSVSSHHGMGK